MKYLTIEKQCDPSASRNSNNDTPIHLASLNGHLEVVRFFISELNCNPNITGRHDETPLHSAASHGHLHIVKYLIEEQNCNLSCKDEDDDTPLHAASRNGHLDVVKYLVLEKNCNPRVHRNIDSNTPVELALFNGHMEVVRFFISKFNRYPKFPRKYWRTSLHPAANHGLFKEEQSCKPSCLAEMETFQFFMGNFYLAKSKDSCINNMSDYRLQSLRGCTPRSFRGGATHAMLWNMAAQS